MNQKVYCRPNLHILTYFLSIIKNAWSFILLLYLKTHWPEYILPHYHAHRIINAKLLWVNLLPVTFMVDLRPLLYTTTR